ncbi:MAG: hypothetical protein AAF481_17875 [Acidobacteriota bacterium]
MEKTEKASPVDKARERFQDAAETVQETYRKVSDDVRRGADRAASELKDGAQRSTEAAARGLRDGFEQVRGQARSLTDDLNDFVQDNPGRAVVVAAAAGFLIGLLFRGRGE